MSFEYAIALTGGISTGKSSVVDIMLSLGFEVIDADKIAHIMLDKYSKDIASMFGDSLIVDEKVDRKALGAIVFGDANKLKKLEEFIHPIIYNHIEELSEILDRKKKPYLVDIPLFFESKRYNSIKKSIVVYTNKDKQIKRLIIRDSCTKDEAIHRVELQMDIEEKYKKGTYIIDNNDGIDELEKRCERLTIEISEEF